MSKSYAEMADEILKGALTDPGKNPFDPAVGHQAHMPAMDAGDTLLEVNDFQRAQLLQAAGVEISEMPDKPKPKQTPMLKEAKAPKAPKGLTLSAEDLSILSEAKKIIEKIQEATTVGTIGVNLAGGKTDKPAKLVKIPGDVNVSKAPKLRVKKTKTPSSDFLSYLKA
jgi:hypothetical protein|tara:strand:- start:348 stop:851 length:504 start_codon:yes stop_codon:yes gene_type:complete